MKKDKLHDELNEHAPFLNELRQKGDGLRVPVDYFDKLENDVFRQLDAIGARRKPAAFAKTKADRSWWQWMQYLWQPRFAFATVALLSLALAGWWYFGKPAQPDTVAVAISAEDAEAYLLDNLLELEASQIAMILPADELLHISIDAEPAPEDTKTNKHELQLSPEDLEDLLRDMTDEELEELL